MKSFPQPCEFPRVSGHPLHHGMTNQNGQGQVLGGQAPSESARLEAEQGHATSRHESPLSHPSCRRSAQAQDSGVSKFHHPKSKIQNPRVSVSTPYSCRGRNRGEKSKIQNLKFGESAFSLTEVVIAMGVAAVAFTSIIALFPLGLNMSKESYEATQAALIAQAIMADLSDQTSTSGGKLIQKTGSNDLVAANYETISMSGSSSTRNIYLAYAQDVRADSSNSPIMLRPTNSSLTLPDWYTKGTNGSVLLVKVTMDKTFHFAGSGTAPSRTGGYPQKVDVSVESPASAPATNRTQHLFSGVIPYK